MSYYWYSRKDLGILDSARELVALLNLLTGETCTLRVEGSRADDATRPVNIAYSGS
jgi:hypothetical protein